MSKYSICLIDNNNQIKYNLGNFDPGFNCDQHKFEVEFEFGQTQFRVMKYSTTHTQNKKECCNVKQKSNKVKKASRKK